MILQTHNSEIEKSEKVSREQILGFENQMRKMPGVKFGDLDNCPLKHRFADGVYVREIFIPKGMLIVGKIHRHSHPNFLMRGEVTVVTEGAGIERLKAPLSMISPAATKRVVYAHEDTVWITVHVTDDRDLDKIEEQVIAKSYDEFDASRTILVNDDLNMAKLSQIIKNESEE